MRYLALLAVALVACSADSFVSGDGGGADAAVDAPGTGDGGSGGGDACVAVPMSCPQNSECANFDQGSGNYGPFKDASQQGQIQITTSQYHSCPSSLEADLPASGATPARAAANFDSNGLSVLNPHATLDAWVMLPTSVSGTFSALTLYAGDSRVQVTSSNGNWLLHVDASNQDQGIKPWTGHWNHMRLDVIFSSDGGTGMATLSYDGDNGVPAAPAIINDKTWAGSSTNLVADLGADVGLAGFAQQAVTAYYDDVQLTLPP